VTDAYCGSGCQSQFGSCSVPASPSCDSSAKSATNGRRVGYYQASQAWGRACDQMSPNQINTTGLTHLILAFAQFDSGFHVIPANNQDETYYSSFTSLQSSSLETWISIGGGGFSTSTWSAMISIPANRATFTSSLQAFMQHYGFQGADIDFEFPAADGSDSQNLVALISDMKAAFGSDYGISLTLPADWGSIRGFDPAGMASNLDFFNYMAYDIRGWGVQSGTSQGNVSYPADIRDVAVDMMPLWANATDPKLVNLGVPYYGRGYTLASGSCTTVGCEATGPSVAGSCTKHNTGILSLAEIEGIQGITVTLDQAAMQKYAVWGATQWVGYDDAETIALKAGWADSQCLGGIMFWSVDFV
jgi:chitinase